MAKQLRVCYDPLGSLDLIIVGANTSKFSGIAEEREGLLVERDGRTNEITAYSLPNFPDQYKQAIQQLRELAPAERYDVPQANLSEVTLSDVVEWARRTYLAEETDQAEAVSQDRLRTTISCLLKNIIPSPWADSIPDSRERFWQALQNSGWFGSPPQRFGFAECARLTPDVIYGLFVHQHRFHLRQYDEQKRKRFGEVDNHEWILFVLLLPKGQVLVQNKRFVHRAMTMPTMLSRFQVALKLVCQAAQLPPFDKMENYSYEYSRAEFLETFANARVAKLEVSGLRDKQVPDSVRLFNPQPGPEGVLRDAIAKDNHELDRVSLEACEDGDLHNTKYAKALIHCGDPERMIVERDGIKKELRRIITEQWDFEVDADALPPKDIEQMVAKVWDLPVSHATTTAPPPRSQPKQGSLFDEQ